MNKHFCPRAEGKHLFNIYIPTESAPKTDGPDGLWKNLPWGKGGIEINFKDLQQRLSEILPPRDKDILITALAIAHADRCANRGHGHRWRRHIKIRIPVAEPELWSQTAVTTPLIVCLELLTGDAWEFEFYHRYHKFATSSLVDMFPINAKQVMPYSDGLDSRITWDLMQSDSLLAVTICHRSTPRQENYKILPSWVGVKICVGGDSHSHLETSYRTRTFLYFTICAIIAKQFGIREILIPESGQGAVGAAMTPFGNDYQYYGSHPLSTHYLHNLLFKILDHEAPKFKHPNIWRTKGQLLNEWHSTFSEKTDSLLHNYSCASKHLSRKNIATSKRHCGICPNCMLRRVALSNAALESVHEQDNYIWSNLSSPTLDDNIKSMQNIPAHSNVVLHPHSITLRQWAQTTARSSFIIHRDFANMATCNHSAMQKIIQANQLAQGLSIGDDQALTKLDALIKQHAKEWQHFVLRHVGQNSWFDELLN